MQTITRHRDEGDAHWFLNSLVTTKVTADETAGTYGISEHLLTAASNPPRHVHHDEEEAFYVLDGELDLHVDGTVQRCRPGSFALVPRGVEHAFQVVTDTVRMLVIGSSPAPTTAGGMQAFFAAAGSPAAERVLPEPAAPDPEALGATAAAHGIAITGPPV